MTNERIGELRKILDEHGDAPGVSMSLFRECVEALEQSRTVYLVRYHYDEFPIAAVYRTKEAAARDADDRGDYDVDAEAVLDYPRTSPQDCLCVECGHPKGQHEHDRCCARGDDDGTPWTCLCSGFE